MLPMLAAFALGIAAPQEQPQPALTPEQVEMRLALLVVFTLTDAEGKPLVIEEKIEKFAVFTSAKDAVVSLDKLKESKPEVAAKLKVTAITLAQAYQMEQKSATTSKPMLIRFVPNDSEMATAKQLVKAQGTDPDKFNGVPVFAPKLKSAGKYLTITYAGGPVYPFFLSMSDLQPFLDRFRQANPGSANDLVVEVSSLEGVIKNLQTSTDASVAQIAFINTAETRAYLKAQADGG